MSLSVACGQTQPRSVLSDVTTTAVAVITAMTFSASGAAPTALYHQYQDGFGLTPFAITIIFAAYVLSLLAALLTVGSLSDFIGRRPAILAALALNIVSMAMFMTASSEAALIGARALQGFATGLATASLGAAILDNDRSRGPILNSITAFCGPDRRQPRRGNSGDLRTRSAPAHLCRASGLVRCRGLHSLVYARNRASARRRYRVAAAPG
jgi:hypothetical protein